MRTARAAGIRGGLEELAATRGRAPGLASKLLPQARPTFAEGMGLTPSAEAFNPLVRAAVSPVRRYGMTESLDTVRARLAAVDDEIAAMPGDSSLVATKQTLESTIKAAEAAGLKRIETPKFARLNVNIASRKLIADIKSRALNLREKESAQRIATAQRYISEDPTLVDRGAVIAQGLDIDLPGYELPVWAERQGLGDVEGGRVVGEPPSEPPLAGIVEETQTGFAVREGGAELLVKAPKPDEDFARVGFVQVPEELRRQGIASRLYDQAAQEVERRWPGKRLRSDDANLTPEGEAVWESFVGKGRAQALERAEFTPRWIGDEPKTFGEYELLPNVGADPTVFGDVLSPEELTRAEALTPAIAQRSQAVSGKIDDFIARMETDRTTLTAGGWDVDAEIDGARRVARGLADGLRRQTQHQDPQAPDVDAAIRMADELRLDEFEELADGFTAGGLTPREALDRAYRPLRAKYGLDYDAEAKDFVGGPPLAELDDALHAAGEAQPVYFPHIDATRLRSSDFFVSSRTQGANIYAKDPHNEQMRLVLLKRGTWLKDPIEVAKRRGARIVREQETFNLWDKITKQTGIPMSDPSMVPRGYRLVSPDVLFIHHRSRTQLLDELDRQLTMGTEPDAALAIATRKVMDRNQADVAELQEAGNVKMYAVPEVVLKNLDSAAKWAPAFGGKNVRLFWDTPMNAWRGLALTASPRWIVNNVLGNIVFGLMQGVKMTDVMRIFGEKYRVMLSNWARRRTGAAPTDVRETSLAGQVKTLPGAEDLGKGYVGNVIEQYVPRLGAEAENTAFGRAIMASRESRPMIAMRRAGEGMKHLNSVIEDSFREASFLTAIEKAQGRGAITRTARSFWSAKGRMEDIMEKGFTPERAASMIREVDRSFGRYGTLSPFERHVVRRWLFPFWGFYKHQLQLLMRFPIEMPGRAQVAAALGQANDEMMEQYGPLPEWLEGAMPMGPPGSEVTFLTTRGADPFSGTFQPPTAMLAPPIKIALEQSLGRDLFTGDEFSDPNTVKPFGSDQHFQILRDAEGNAVGVEPSGAPRPGLGTHLLGQIPQFDILAPLVAGGVTYDTAPLTPLTDETGEPLFPTTGLDQLARFGGYPTIDYDLQRYQERLAQEQAAALRAALSRGV
jgi:ribosomal protein S18 acetylase RimI-like enzyme